MLIWFPYYPIIIRKKIVDLYVNVKIFFPETDFMETAPIWVIEGNNLNAQHQRLLETFGKSEQTLRYFIV